MKVGGNVKELRAFSKANCDFLADGQRAIGEPQIYN